MKKLLLALFITTAIVYGGSVVSVSALTISPVKLELEADPGQTIGGVFELHNEEGNARTLYVSYENFEPSGDLGTPRFVGRDGGLATWMTATPELVIEPDKRMTVPYTITVPADAKPGGYFAAIFYGGQNPNAIEGGEVAIGGKLGLLVLLRVRGDITEEGGINIFGTKDNGRFFTSLPISFVTQMTNRGGDRIVPRGSVVITNLFGMEAARLEVNTNAGSILPNSSRTFTEVWQGNDVSTSTSFMAMVGRQWADFHLGLYRAKAELVWGVDGNTSTATFWFLILPWQLLSVTFVLLIGLWFALRSYNRLIIARAKRA